jgi:hypothetical protein
MVALSGVSAKETVLLLTSPKEAPYPADHRREAKRILLMPWLLPHLPLLISQVEQEHIRGLSCQEGDTIEDQNGDVWTVEESDRDPESQIPRLESFA